MHKNRIDLRELLVSQQQQQQQVKYPQFRVSWVRTKKGSNKPIWVSRQMLEKNQDSSLSQGRSQNSIVVC